MTTDNTIGKICSKDELDNILNLYVDAKKKGSIDAKLRYVFDMNQSKLYMPEDFRKHEGSANLYWKELSEISEHRSSHDFTGFNQEYDVFLDYLLHDLECEGLMNTSSPKRNDFYFVNVGGINVNIPDGSDDHGRTAYTTKTYYPRVLADAEEYVKYFYKDAHYPVYVAQILSLPNKNWKI